MPTRYKLTIAYDGTAYAGWQIQPAHRTVQGELESVIAQISGQNKVRIESSGRTDTGVHARAQIAHVELDQLLSSAKLLESMNALLDADIRILKINKVSKEFHARFSAQKKEYRYFIWNSSVLPPFIRNERLHIRKPLNIDAMNAAAGQLTGEHNFASFAANPKREIDGTVRTIYDLKVLKRGYEVTIIARASGFLYKMVRSLVGFLIRIGLGELPPESASEILKSQKRTAVVPTASPKGLFLWKVYY